MGIKGIYREIGTGRRISLTKLAIEKLEQTGRPLRIAIDISIWQFQVQAARGGANPAIRTLFYRLVRLLGLSIQPVFVFDGPNKPAFKRNKRSGRGDGTARAMAKRLIRLFGFPVHDAPGEAEAECALLQRHGLVDAVLSEDVDTIMFGCSRTLRNWSAEGAKGSQTPTHVSLYDTEELQQGDPGLDREGMVLVALMSGGDYLPEGVPGCGVKLACEAARAGFGQSLCRLKKSARAELCDWRESLRHELKTNESGYFRTKHKALTIPEEFPSLDILRYYTHPVVSQIDALEKLRSNITTLNPLDVEALRAFVSETFDWTYKIGAIKFIRVLAPGLLARKLLDMSYAPGAADAAEDDPDYKKSKESLLVKAISSRRSHFSTDATPELRVSFIPNDIIGLALDKEPEEAVSSFGRAGLALNSDDEFEEQDEPAAGPRKKFDPLNSDLAWIPESLVKLGAPVTVEDWEERQRTKEAARLAPKTPTKRPARKAAPKVQAGAMDRWVKVTKNVSGPPKSSQLPRDPTLSPLSPPSHGLPSARNEIRQRSPLRLARDVTTRAPTPPAGAKSKQSKPRARKAAGGLLAGKQPAAAAPQTDPWTLSRSQVHTSVARVTKPFASTPDVILISSSPAAEPPKAAPHSPLGRPVTPTLPTMKQFRSPPPAAEDVLGSDPFESPTGASPRKQRSPSIRNQGGRGPPASETQSGVTSRRAKPSRAKQMSIQNFDIRTENRVEQADAPTKGEVAPRCAPPSKPEEASSSRPKRYQDEDDDDPFSSPALPESKKKQGSEALQSYVPSSPSGNKVATRKETTKLYMPRDSAVGFFKEVEVDVEEVDHITQLHAEKGRTVWRRSDIVFIDMTGDDE